MIDRRLTAILIALAPCLTACGSHPDAVLDASGPADSGASEPTPYGARVLRSWTGMRGPTHEQSAVLIRDEAAWAARWELAGQSPSDRPAVDFARESVIAVFHGADRAHHSMEATLTRDGDEWLLAYELFSTSGERSPEVDPWGFYVVPHLDAAVRVESHHVHGPSQPIVSVLGSVGD